MRIILTAFIICYFPIYVLAQTSIEEYNFLTKDYPKEKARGFDPELEGYYIQELFEMVDKTGKVLLLYKDSQLSYIPVAAQIQVKDGEKTYYLGIPHDESGLQVMDKSVDDEQAFLEINATVRERYSKVRALYPKQLERYYKQLEILEANGGKDIKEDIPGVDRSVNPNPSKKIESREKGGSMEKEPTRKLERRTLPRSQKRVTKKTRSSKRNRNRSLSREPENISLNELQKPAPNRKRSVGQKSSSKINPRLKRRKLLEMPEVLNTFNEVGKVRIEVCVDAQGKVIRTKYNRKESGTRDLDLVEQAIKLAKRYRFAKSHLSRQCGYVIFNFK